MCVNLSSMFNTSIFCFFISLISGIFSTIMRLISNNIIVPESVSLSISVFNSFGSISIVWIVNWVVINQRKLFLVSIFELNINWFKDGIYVSVHPSIFLVSNGFCSMWIIWIRKTSINPFSVNILIEVSVNPDLNVLVSS